MSKIGQVATALCSGAVGESNCTCAATGIFRCADDLPGKQARAAIAAMREPTKEMVNMGCGYSDLLCPPHTTEEREVRDIWAAMIGKALDETPIIVGPMLEADPVEDQS